MNAFLKIFAISIFTFLVAGTASAQTSGNTTASALTQIKAIDVNLETPKSALNIENLSVAWPAAVETYAERADRRPGDPRGSVRMNSVDRPDYEQLIPLLIQAVQEQQVLIESLQAEIERLKQGAL